MDDQEVRLLQVEGQTQALARAWLYLTAGLEMKGLADPAALEQSMLGTDWQGASFEPHANKTMQYLVDQLAAARENRQRIDLYQSTGRDE